MPIFFSKNYPQAITDYSKVISIYPDYAKAYYNRGRAYLRCGEHGKTQARKDFQAGAALAQKQGNEDLYLFLRDRLKELD